MDVKARHVFDPTTIFVGGLETHGRCTWDEERLRRVFGQYGEIAEVKLVRPGRRYADGSFCQLILLFFFSAHRKSAFAFVTYKSKESSSRAVLAEVVSTLVFGEAP
jgi:RNA recognition motif-containing protein